MVAVGFRALSTVVTVVIAVAVAALWGDSAAGKVLAAVIIATVIALMEGALIWAPKHSATARRLLDPRSVMVGVWIQDVRQATRAAGDLGDELNRFAVFTIDYRQPEGYFVDGRAFDRSGREDSSWTSAGAVMFAKSGREMTYVFTGTVSHPTPGAPEPERTGLVKLGLSDDNSGTGRVEHVALKRSLMFDLYRVTPAWLAQRGLADGFTPQGLSNVGTRNEFALAFAPTLDQRDPASREANG